METILLESGLEIALEKIDTKCTISLLSNGFKIMSLSLSESESQELQTKLGIING